MTDIDSGLGSAAIAFAEDVRYTGAERWHALLRAEDPVRCRWGERRAAASDRVEG